MISVQVSVTQDRWKQVEAALRTALAEVVTQTAEVVKDHAVALCPVRTGKLRDSIEVDHTDPLSPSVTVGEDYGVYVELGTYKMAAQPFLTPAAELAAAAFPDAIERAIREATAG